MPSSDRTHDFRQVMREKENELPAAKRRKTNETERDPQIIPGKEYVAEAYVIVRARHLLLQRTANYSTS
jgi:hypothetical protein